MRREDCERLDLVSAANFLLVLSESVNNGIGVVIVTFPVTGVGLGFSLGRRGSYYC